MRTLLLGFGLAAVAAPAFAAEMTVASPDLKNGATMPMAQVCARYGGGDHSPALSWSGEPAGTESFAVTMYDPDAPTGSGFWHWTMFNIPASVHSLPAGAGDAGATTLPAGAGEGRNDAGVAHYSGACPPPGDPPHHYQITVFAVKVAKLPLDAGSSGARVGFNLHFNTLAKAQLVAPFAKPK
ncbi:MAG TPA: YbhB/YbcL family Raf kinase inhibitor-like protein [Stellaceae bacterium]|nr:YbhB/YbcL family Raf kinase inhibitor-like protein [Stellaceae bacterium]